MCIKWVCTIAALIEKKTEMKDKYNDNTRIEGFRTCARKYYFRHVINLVKEGTPSPALVFGGAWHAAMDSIWNDLAGGAPNWGDQEVVERAYEAFMDKWVSEGMSDLDDMSPEDIKDLGARTPLVAHEMLYEYVLQRREFLSKIELLAVEQPFAVPLDLENPDLLYVGRLDKVFRYKKDVLVAEHKTTSLYRKEGYFRNTFIDQFSPNSQIDGYIHALRVLYGDEAKGVWVDGALVHRNVHDGFIFIPIERQLAQLDAWLWETRYWISQINFNYDALNHMHEIAGAPAEELQKYMPAFPKNTSACQDYNVNCPYLNICKGVANPAGIDGTPLGYKEDPWSPFDRLQLEKIGMGKDG